MGVGPLGVPVICLWIFCPVGSKVLLVIPPMLSVADTTRLKPSKVLASSQSPVWVRELPELKALEIVALKLLLLVPLWAEPMALSRSPLASKTLTDTEPGSLLAT